MNATTYGLDLAKAVFQVYWVDGQGRTHNRRIKRAQLSEFFARAERGRVVMEACASAHHWARVLGGLGHEVRLIAAQAGNDRRVSVAVWVTNRNIRQGVG